MSIEIEGKEIAEGKKAFLIAELSANHDGNMDQCIAILDIVANAGWDAFKLQTYTADSLTINSRHPSLSIDPIWGKANLYELYASSAMPMEFHKPLFELARARGLLPFTSVYDPRDLAFTEELGCSLYKIASFELTFDDLLIEIAKTRKPIVVSTGMANLQEIDYALNLLEKNGAGEVVILHCISAYPTPFDEVNLAALNTVRSRFGRMTGFSDHTVGARASIFAAVLGAVAIEKHVTNNTRRNGPDHRFSATEDVLKEIAQGITDAWVARGTGVKETTPSETSAKEIGRRSAFALRDLPKGHIITSTDFRFIRPGVGIPANKKHEIIGKKLLRLVREGTPINYEDIQQ